jgi:chloramphenicol 3-O-phosphotransferase
MSSRRKPDASGAFEVDACLIMIPRRSWAPGIIMSITIISGTPGAGKTSLARALAASDARGVHIETDEFFRFLAHPIGPTSFTLIAGESP